MSVLVCVVSLVDISLGIAAVCDECVVLSPVLAPCAYLYISFHII
jgi:hypothetical protein